MFTSWGAAFWFSLSNSNFTLFALAVCLPYHSWSLSVLGETSNIKYDWPPRQFMQQLRATSSNRYRLHLYRAVPCWHGLQVLQYLAFRCLPCSADFNVRLLDSLDRGDRGTNGCFKMAFKAVSKQRRFLESPRSFLVSLRFAQWTAT